MRCVNKLIYIYNDLSDSLMKNRHDLMELNCLIYRHEAYLDIFKSRSDEKYLIPEYLEIINFLEESENYYKLIKENKKIRLNLIKIFVKFTNKYELSKNMKEKITEFLNKIY